MPNISILSRHDIPNARFRGSDTYWVERGAIRVNSHIAEYVIPSDGSRSYHTRSDTAKYMLAASLTLGGGLDPLAKISAITCYGPDVHIFWIANDGNIYTAYWKNNGLSSDWVSDMRYTTPKWICNRIPINHGRGIANPQSNIVALARKPDSQNRSRDIIEVFWVGQDGAIWTNYREGEQAGQAWPNNCVALTSTNETHPLASLAAVSRNEVQIDVLWLTSSGVKAVCSWGGHRSGSYVYETDTINNVQAPLTAISRSTNSLDVVWFSAEKMQRSCHWDEGNNDWKTLKQTLSVPVMPIGQHILSFALHRNTAQTGMHHLWVGTDKVLYAAMWSSSSADQWNFIPIYQLPPSYNNCLQVTGYYRESDNCVVTFFTPSAITTWLGNFGNLKYFDLPLTAIPLTASSALALSNSASEPSSVSMILVSLYNLAVAGSRLAAPVVNAMAQAQYAGQPVGAPQGNNSAPQAAIAASGDQQQLEESPNRTSRPSS